MVAVPATRQPARSERTLFVAAAVAAVLIIFAGFARTFYLKGAFDAPPLSNLLFAHGVVMTLWMGLFLTQLGLVAARRVELHRRLGIAGAVVAAAVVAVGIAAGIDAGRRGFSPSPDVTPVMFMAVPIFDVLVFGALVAAGLALRRRRDWHKRLMLLAMLGILTPGFARLPVDAIRDGGLPVFFGGMLLIVAIVVVADTVRNRRLHPAFGWGVAFLAASVPLRIALAGTDAWAAFAQRLIG